MEELSASHSTDLQQRAYELQAVIGLDAHAVESIIPSDASCEDIEVIPLSQRLIHFSFVLIIIFRFLEEYRCFGRLLLFKTVY